MSILVRRISRAKWDNAVKDDDGLFDVDADAITNCLKTTDNTLSVWEIDDESKLDEAILALTTGKKQEQFSKIDFVLIDENMLKDKGLLLVNSDGDTVINFLIKKHRNISSLSYKKLGIMKDIILYCINNEKHKFKTKREIIQIVKEAIDSGALQKSTLNEKLIENEKL
ncbi:hypothetical protein EZS27_024645 [termite gut metagenome]|uniref:Uncharacterized protein n=1 Tax=termite gut metagenome TaxID=433724 RepID=A0A5J4QY58_9ZZZZ